MHRSLFFCFKKEMPRIVNEVFGAGAHVSEWPIYTSDKFKQAAAIMQHWADGNLYLPSKVSVALLPSHLIQSDNINHCTDVKDEFVSQIVAALLARIASSSEDMNLFFKLLNEDLFHRVFII